MDDVIAEAGMTGSSYNRLISSAEYKRFVMVRTQSYLDTHNATAWHKLVVGSPLTGDGVPVLVKIKSLW